MCNQVNLDLFLENFEKRKEILDLNQILDFDIIIKNNEL
jgi:hypothetical protein